MERLIILREVYPNYLLYDKKIVNDKGNIKEKVRLYGVDKKIANTFSKKEINYIVINGLEIEKKVEYDNNLYDKYKKIINIIDLVLLIKERMIINEKQDNN